MSNEINGAILMAQLAIALFFLKYWKQSHDRLFAWFSVAFVLLGTERVVFVLVSPLSESRPYIYTIRLISFLVIAYAVFEKNRNSKPSKSTFDSSNPPTGKD